MKQYTIVSNKDALERVQKSCLASVMKNRIFYDDLAHALMVLEGLNKPDAMVVEVGVNITEEISAEDIRAAECQRAIAILGDMSNKPDANFLRRLLNLKSTDELPEPKLIMSYLVDSFTEDDKVYRVEEYNDGRWTCECPAYEFSNHKEEGCKHIDVCRHENAFIWNGMRPRPRIRPL